MNLVYILLSVTLTAAGQVLLKLGADRSNEGTAALYLRLINGYNITGLILYGISALFWMLVLKRTELSYAYPFVAFSYILVFAASHYILGETLSLNRVIGLAFIIVGILFIARS